MKLQTHLNLNIIIWKTNSEIRMGFLFGKCPGAPCEQVATLADELTKLQQTSLAKLGCGISAVAVCQKAARALHASQGGGATIVIEIQHPIFILFSDATQHETHGKSQTRENNL